MVGVTSMLCPFCGEPITNFPRKSEEYVTHSCGAKYYFIFGDESDVIESLLDYFGLITPEFDVEYRDKEIHVKYHDTICTAVKIEYKNEDIENFGLYLWAIFIQRCKG